MIATISIDDSEEPTHDMAGMVTSVERKLGHPVRGELGNKHKSIKVLREKSEHDTLTLLHAAHDREHNSALVLKRFLEEAMVG